MLLPAQAAGTLTRGWCVVVALGGSRPSLEVVLNRWDSRHTRHHIAFAQLYAQLGRSVDNVVLRLSRRPWRIQFAGEGGQDVGGLFSEAMTMACEELMLDGLGLFIPTPNQAQT